MKIFIVFLSIFLFADVNIDIKTKTVNMDYKSTLFVKSKNNIKKFKINYNAPKKMLHKVA